MAWRRAARLEPATEIAPVLLMNDAPPVRIDARKPVVRPRDAASLILLRGEGKTLEVLAGRRPLHVKFMPGVYVFPGGAIDPPDRIAWSVESRIEALGSKLARSARAALRETWEEAGVLVGCPGSRPSALPARAPVEQAYLDRGGQRENAAYGWVRSDV